MKCRHCGSTTYCKWQQQLDAIDVEPPCVFESQDMRALDIECRRLGRWIFIWIVTVIALLSMAHFLLS